LVYFSPFSYFVPRKIWQPWRRGSVQGCQIFIGATYQNGTKYTK
jgi:hypothetical protein